MENKEPGIHFGWVYVLAVVGIVVTSLAFWGPFVPSLGDNAMAVWQSILTNFGVGVFSAAVLLLFEPKLRRVISKTVSTTVTEEVKKDVREAVKADIEERFASLEDAISSRYDQMLATQQGLAQDLVANFTHDRVMKLFREASNLSALASQSITVHGDAAPGDFLRVRFRLQLETADPEQFALHVSVTPRGEHLPADVIWEPGQDFADVAMALASELNFKRVRGLAQKIEWGPILGRLEKALYVAINASMKTEGALALDGGVIDFIEGRQDWYLTEYGLYCPEISYHLPPQHFRQQPKRAGSTSRTLNEVPPLGKPEDVESESEWEYVFELAKRNFRPHPFAGLRV